MYYCNNTCTREEILKKYDIEFIIEKEKDYIAEKNRELKDKSFYICNYAKIVREAEKFLKESNGVVGYYEVRANNDLAILHILSNLEFGFKCYSLQEVRWVRQVSTNPIIFGIPAISSFDMKWLSQYHIDYIVCDSKDQLPFIKQYLPDSKIILYVMSEDTDDRFGLDFRAAAHLMTNAKEMDLQVAGIYMNIQTKEFVEDAKVIISGFREIFKLRKFDFDIVLTNEESFEYIKELPPTQKNFVSLNSKICQSFITSSELITSIKFYEESREILYYLLCADLYIGQCFQNLKNCILPSLTYYDTECKEKYKCSFFGPTCDSSDCITKEVEFIKLNIGDRIIFDDVGNFSSVYGGTEFNGFKDKYNILRVFIPNF